MIKDTTFSIDFLVIMSLGRIFCLIAFTKTRPESPAESVFSGSTAAITDDPIRLIPKASNEEDIVFAVNIPPQAPKVGHAFFSIPTKSSFEIFPALYEPTAS